MSDEENLRPQTESAEETSIVETKPTEETLAVETKPTEETAVEKKMDAQIDELIKVFQDPNAPFDDKVHAVIRIPTEIEHQYLTRERADRLFSNIPVELFSIVFDPESKKYTYFASCRTIFIHILAFFCQCTSPEVHMRIKPVLPNIIRAASPKEMKVGAKSTLYSDLSVIIAFWVDSKGEGQFVYESLRYVTGYYAAQKRDLNVPEFLISIRLLINKIYQLASVETQCYDNRGWPFAILSVVRDLLQHSQEKFTKEMRVLLWDIISAMTRLGGLPWFNTDKQFAKLVIQMNHVEIQMALHDPEKVDAVGFNRHLRVLELYTNGICDKDMFGEDGMEVVPHTVGDSTRFILTFWVECYLQKIPLPDTVSMSIYNYATFLFIHEELAITEERVRKHIGPVFLENAFIVLNNSRQEDLYGEVGQMLNDVMEKLNEFEMLDDRVPLLVVQFLNKLRTVEHYEEWKGRVDDCRSALVDLRGRVDWYSKKTLKEAKDLCEGFTEPEKHEMFQIFKVFDQLPRVN